MAPSRPALPAVRASTRLYCVLGHPVAHSLSPAMHNAALAHVGLDAVYLAFDVAPGRLEAALRGLAALGAGGVNLTIPHKEAALGLMDELAPDAARFGAVNTVIPRSGGLLGDNTDGRGFLCALREAGFEPAGARAMLLGAGGSARSIAFALAGAGARIVIVNRNEERGKKLAAELGDAFGPGTAEALEAGAPAGSAALKGCTLLVNATPVGMRTGPEAEMPLDPAWLHDGLFVFDLVYDPAETPLLAAARARGCRTENGLSMLVHQGALAFELWTGRPAPVERMREAAQAALAGKCREEGCAPNGAET